MGDESSIPPNTSPLSSSTPSLSQPNPGSTPGQSKNATPLPSTSHNPKANAGLKGGAVAGVAIGMLIAGFLIAGVVFFFLLRRQKRRQRATFPTDHTRATYNSRSEKGPAVLTSSVQSTVDNYLPQPVSDDTLTEEVSKIRGNIKNHVRTFCHSAPVTPGINEAALGNIAAAAGISSATLVGALTNPTTRHEALRLVMAWIMLSKTTGPCNAGLLPPDLRKLSSNIAGAESTPSRTVLFSKWKTITGALLQSHFGKNAQDPSRAQTFTNVIAELDSIVAPFVQGSIDGGQRRKNLEMIIGRAANLAFLLFSQPGSFHFEFASRGGGLAAFPAFLQTVGDSGQAMNPPRILSQAEYVAVRELHSA